MNSIRNDNNVTLVPSPSSLVPWNNFPPDVIEILLRDFNNGKKIFDGDIANVVPRALKSDDEKISRTRSIAEVFTPPKTIAVIRAGLKWLAVKLRS